MIIIDRDTTTTETARATADGIAVSTASGAAIGIATTFVDEGNVDERFHYSALDAPPDGGIHTVIQTGASLVHKLPEIRDKLRASLGAYWSDQDPEMIDPSPDTNNLIYVRNEHPNIGPLNIIFGSSDRLEKLRFTAKTGKFNDDPIAAATAEFTSNIGAAGAPPPTFTEYVQYVIKEDEWFYDHTMVVNKPFARHEIERLNSGLRTMYANIEPQYNFYVENYETVISSSTAKEISFPNIYVFFAHRAAIEKYEEDKANGLTPILPNPAFEDHITLGGSMNENIFRARNTSQEFQLSDLTGQYFDAWSRSYSDNISNKFKNIFFSLGDMDMFAKSNRQEWLFPMYTNIEFSTDVGTEFAEILKQTQLSSMLLSDIYESVEKSNNYIKMFQAVRSSVLAKTDIDNPSGASLNITKTHYDIGSRRSFDVEKWVRINLTENVNKYEDFIESLASDFPDGYDADNSIFIGAYVDEKKVSKEPQYVFWKNLMSVIFSGKLQRLVENHQRSLKEVLEGKPAYHETVCYRVAKFKGRAGSAIITPPIQNFYFPNSNEIDVLNFIDTQVKYGKTYTYVVYAYELVVGSKYKYYPPVFTSDAKLAQVLVDLKPSLKIIEIPYYKKTIHMLDSPPTHPEVDFVPYRGVNNRVRLQFNGSVGKYEMHPAVISDRDEAQNNLFRIVQNRLPDEKIKYESDDHPAKFQVWRIDKKPRRWSDFAGHLRKTVSTSNKDFSATSATFIDKIRPNKKYYYAFRSIDVHGHVSYPTVIYEYEMVNDSASIYPLIRVISLESVEPSTPAKSAKRYIRIYPSLDNTLIDPKIADGVESGNELTTVPLGIHPEGERAWEKKFKIRITSKNTGKKFDLNVSFKYKHATDSMLADALALSRL